MSAQAVAKRRPGKAFTKILSPERATQTAVSVALSGLNIFLYLDPGLRFATAWAVICRAFSPVMLISYSRLGFQEVIYAWWCNPSGVISPAGVVRCTISAFSPSSLKPKGTNFPQEFS